MDYSPFTIGALKNELQYRNLPISGNKKAIIKRLLEDDIMSDISIPEIQVRLRDRKYYDYIKNEVIILPNLLRMNFKTTIAKESLKEWTKENKWRAIRDELNTLDQSVLRGEEGEIEQKMINCFVGDTCDEFHKEDIVRFFETYPYLSYVIVQLETRTPARYYAISANKLHYILKFIHNMDLNEIIEYIDDISIFNQIDQILGIYGYIDENLEYIVKKEYQILYFYLNHPKINKNNIKDLLFVLRHKRIIPKYFMSYLLDKAEFFEIVFDGLDYIPMLYSNPKTFNRLADLGMRYKVYDLYYYFYNYGTNNENIAKFVINIPEILYNNQLYMGAGRNIILLEDLLKYYPSFVCTNQSIILSTANYGDDEKITNLLKDKCL